MQNFQYNYVKYKYGDKTEMLLTDTDSLLQRRLLQRQKVI